MADQLKYLYDPIPDRLSLKLFFNWNAADMLRFDTMKVPDRVAQFFDMAQTDASRSSPTLQNDFSTPAAIAGVQRSVL